MIALEPEEPEEPLTRAEAEQIAEELTRHEHRHAYGFRRADWRRIAEQLHAPAGSFTCPRCGMTSHNANDVREGYCGNCHDWTRDAR
jgi:rubrerythrin